MATPDPVIDPVTGQPPPVPPPVSPPVSPTNAQWISSQQQVDDSMANKVNEIASKDSPLNQMARTEGLKAANSRGLLNSSMAVGAAQDAVLRNVLPIASQDAAQAFQKNQAARGFEYGMTAQEQEQGFKTSERLGTQTFLTAERLGAQEFTGTQNDLDRKLQQSMLDQQISATEKNLIMQIASTEGIAAAANKLQETLQKNDIAYRMQAHNLDLAAAVQEQKNAFAFEAQQNAATRALQEKIAKMNLTGSQQAAAGQMASNAQAAYQSEYQSIMNNTKLTSAQRTSFLKAANTRYTNAMKLVENTFKINLGY